MNGLQRASQCRRLVRAQHALDALSLEALTELQWRKLGELLRFAYERIPFYRGRFQAIGAEPEDIRTPEDFRAFPMLTRDDVLDHAEEMLACPQERLRPGRSGGSTGHPLTFYTEPDHKYLLRAISARTKAWIGADGLWPCFTLWSVMETCNVPTILHSWHKPFKRHYRYTFPHVDRAALSRVARDFLLVQPPFVHGYASLLRAFAQHLLEEGKAARRPPLVVMSMGETLTEGDRALIQKGLGGPVYNVYGASETSLIASECRCRNGLHVLTDHIYLEILGDRLPAEPGEPGYLVVTDLDNLAMPFIRYRNADIGAWAEGKCSCGRQLPLLSAVYGREIDFVFDRQGAAYPGIDLIYPLNHLIKSWRIRQLQFVQDEPGRVRVLAVPGRDMDPGVEGELRAALHRIFHGAIEVSIVWVESIQPEPSGKTRFIRSGTTLAAAWRMHDQLTAE